MKDTRTSVILPPLLLLPLHALSPGCSLYDSAPSAVVTRCNTASYRSSPVVGNAGARMSEGNASRCKALYALRHAWGTCPTPWALHEAHRRHSHSLLSSTERERSTAANVSSPQCGEDIGVIKVGGRGKASVASMGFVSESLFIHTLDRCAEHVALHCAVGWAQRGAHHCAVCGTERGTHHRPQRRTLSAAERQSGLHLAHHLAHYEPVDTDAHHVLPHCIAVARAHRAPLYSCCSVDSQYRREPWLCRPHRARDLLRRRRQCVALRLRDRLYVCALLYRSGAHVQRDHHDADDLAHYVAQPLPHARAEHEPVGRPQQRALHVPLRRPQRRPQHGADRCTVCAADHRTGPRCAHWRTLWGADGTTECGTQHLHTDGGAVCRTVGAPVYGSAFGESLQFLFCGGSHLQRHHVVADDLANLISQLRTHICA
eukprot:gene15643-biopygen61509